MIKAKVLVSILGFFCFFVSGAYAVNTANCSMCRGTNASMWQCDGRSWPGYNTIDCSCAKYIRTGNIQGVCPTNICSQQGGCRARDCYPSLFKKHHHHCTAWVICDGPLHLCKMNPNGKKKTVCVNYRDTTIITGMWKFLVNYEIFKILFYNL